MLRFSKAAQNITNGSHWKGQTNLNMKIKYMKIFLVCLPFSYLELLCVTLTGLELQSLQGNKLLSGIKCQEHTGNAGMAPSKKCKQSIAKRLHVLEKEFKE